MAESLKNYKATINGIEHTFLLNDEDATARGLDPAKDAISDADLVTSPLDFDTPTTDGQAVEPNVAADEAAATARREAAAEADAKARTAANKARTAADK
jgi:hypothetical protein